MEHPANFGYWPSDEEYPSTVYLWAAVSYIVVLMAALVGNGVLIGFYLVDFCGVPIDRQHAVRDFSH